MTPPADQRRPPMLTPQLARRVALLGTFALAMFGILFFRLWFLQILSGQHYLAQARANGSIRTVQVPAPRGWVLDSNGDILVDNTRSLSVQLSVPNLPQSTRQRRALYHRLYHVLGMPARPRRCVFPVAGQTRPAVQRLGPIPCDIVQQQARVPYANVTVKDHVSRYTEFYILERQNLFPGVQVQQVYERHYPLGPLAAQLFGTVGRITAAELNDPRYQGASPNDVVGQSGLEWYYNRYLQGQDGKQRVLVNAAGAFERYLKEIPPTPGHTLKLSLDMQLQRVGQQALQQSINTNPPADAGSFVAMNPDSGQIYAMGSLPTFNPNVFTRPITYAQYNSMFGPRSNFPLLNRATQSVGPTGSTFKGITATAALQSGVWSLSQTFDDTGQFCFGGLCRHNAGGAADGVLNIVNAIRVSSDVFFYNLGVLLNSDRPQGGALQKWAHLYGIGRPTGVDLGGEAAGNLPSPAWRAHVDKLQFECQHRRGPYKHYHGVCQIADGRPWSAGDNENLAVGQGDVQVTPLQLAVAYSAIANGGAIVRPHVGAAIESGNGTVMQQINPPPLRHLHYNPVDLAAIREGLHEAAQSPGGTSDDVFGSFPEKVYGKTGTAQYTGQQDYAWYVCFVPSWATGRPILVVVHVERGGFGAVGAAPVAHEILSQWFFGHRGKYVAGSSRTF
ncbi:MAG: penicillin-binding protein 2 [Solirubrobacterales bacterium]|nr:penicillin-binding protein 2 [Solirubrobacterales bacterium]